MFVFGNTFSRFSCSTHYFVPLMDYLKETADTMNSKYVHNTYHPREIAALEKLDLHRLNLFR